MGLLDGIKSKLTKKPDGPAVNLGTKRNEDVQDVIPSDVSVSGASGGTSAAIQAKTPVENNKGGYLIFDTASNGTLFIVWSAEKVEGALAFFFPNKPVADFKYSKGGKNEIIRNLMENKVKYYEGWCQFFKMGAEFHGNCVILPGAENAPLKVECAFLDGSTVKRLVPGQSMPAKGISAVGCVPKGSDAFQVKSLQRDVFLRNARQGGAGITC